MIVGADEPCPLPTDPLLVDVARAAAETGQAAWIVDAEWRFEYVTDAARSLWLDNDGGRLGSVAIGHHVFSTESLRVASGWRFGLTTIELWREALRSLGGMVLADTAGGRDRLRGLIDPSLRDVIDDVDPCGAAAHALRLMTMGPAGPIPSGLGATRIRDEQGQLRGTVLVGSPILPIGLAASMGSLDLAHLDRMMSLFVAGKRPAAVLMADLERSSLLSRRLSTAHYFTLGRRLVRAADQCVIDAGGLLGRHVGDGVAAFFPAETSGSESAAARACISAARAMRTALPEVAERCDVDSDNLVARFGLHWGASLYIGNITTAGRLEVTALGDDVNDTARIEGCATGGRMLASKHLIECLDADDSAVLGIDPDRIVYSQLADLGNATEKARRDVPAIAVCDL